jgi:hypothetical protein
MTTGAVSLVRVPGSHMSRRMRAAIAALPFEHPKLSVTANVGPHIGFARALENARKVRDELANWLVIEGEAERIGRSTVNSAGSIR